MDANNNNNVIIVIPIPNNNFDSNNLTITNPIIDNSFNFDHTGTYTTSSSSYANDKCKAYNAFNNSSNSYWQSSFKDNNSGGTINNYAYSQHPYTNAVLNNFTNVLNNVKSAYQGGGSNDTKWTTKISYSNPNYGSSIINGEWIQIKFNLNYPEPMYLYSYSIITPITNNDGMTFPTKFMVVGSTDGNNWEYIDQQNLSIINTTTKKTMSFNINSTNDPFLKTPTNYTYYRLIILEMPPYNSVVRINQWILKFLPYLGFNKNPESFTPYIFEPQQQMDVGNLQIYKNLEFINYKTSIPIENEQNKKIGKYILSKPEENIRDNLNTIRTEYLNSLKNENVLPIICISILAISIIFIIKNN